jgi:methionyl-tRNA formyltransferase
MRILFIGTGDIGLPALHWLLGSGHELAAVFTQPDKPAGRRMELLASPIKQLALDHHIPVLQPIKMRAPEAVAQVQSFQADVIVVMAYGQILPQGVLDAARIACINLHASILPRHRGAAPIQSAILSGDTETGVTVMYVDPGLDTGDILLIHRLPIQRHDTGGTLHDRLAAATPAALAEALPLLETRTAPRIPQDNTQATYAKKLTREDGQIPWHLPSGQVSRHIRAMNPWPGAFTQLPDKVIPPRKLKVFTAALNRTGPLRSGPPGQILHSGPRGILVACATGSLLLTEIQLEGKRRMPARDFLIGHPLPPGLILGQPKTV